MAASTPSILVSGAQNAKVSELLSESQYPILPDQDGMRYTRDMANRWTEMVPDGIETC